MSGLHRRLIKKKFEAKLFLYASQFIWVESYFPSIPVTVYFFIKQTNLCSLETKFLQGSIYIKFLDIKRTAFRGLAFFCRQEFEQPLNLST